MDAAYKVDPKTGYIRINRFANNTYKEFTDAVQKLGPMDALILDLRSNGGGLMGGAVQLSNFFLPEGSVIVSTEGMRVPPDRIVAKEDGPFTKGKVIVLINETSASASEIVSGAIQDWDRGQRPWYDCWASFVRQGTRPTAVPVTGRLGGAADRSALPHADRTHDPAPV